ncbi:MAG: hypothetical protein ABIA21_03895 [Candidatus Aenigmatarchaeota archaeon]
MSKTTRTLAFVATFILLVASISFATDITIDGVVTPDNVTPGSEVTSQMAMTNHDSTSTTVEINENIMLPNMTILSSSTENIIFSPNEFKIRKSTFALPECSEAGEYSNVINVIENGVLLSSTKKTFTVEEKFVPNVERNITRNLFLTKSTLTIKNIGNTRGVAEINDKLDGYIFFSGDQPTSTNGKDFTWIRELDVCETKTITYSIDYTILMVPLAFVVILLILWFIFFKLSLVRIRKSVHQDKPVKEGEEFTVSLHVKSFVNTTDVEIRDFVPPIFEIVDTPGITPVKTQSNSGTELTWRFGNLNAGEEKVLDYKIKPMFSVTGVIKVSKASILFNYMGKKFKRETRKGIVGTHEKTGQL